MSKMSELILEIQSMAHDMGDDFGFDPETVTTIAEALNVPADIVADALASDDDSYDDYDDSMDGDAESALASAGFGTDEDYGYYGDDY